MTSKYKTDKIDTEAIKEQIQKGFFHNYFDHVCGVAFLFDSFNNNQAFYYATMKTSAFFQKCAKVDFQFYAIGNEKPVFYPQSGLFSINELQHFQDVAIATSINTLSYLMNHNCKHKFYYIYDINELNQLNQQQIADIRNSGVVLFTRNDDYKRVLEGYFGLKVASTNVPDFNIEKLLNVIGIIL